MINLRKVEEIAAEYNDGSLILNCTDLPLHQWLVTSDGVKARLNVNQMDIEPSIFVRGERMFVGAEQGIFVLHMITNRIINEISNVSNVQWVEEDAQDCVLFAAEDEVIALDNLGTLLWRKNLPDVIQTTDIVDGNILVTDMSDGKYRLNLKDGSSA